MADHVHCARCGGYGRLDATEAIPEYKKRVCPDCDGIGHCAVISPERLDALHKQLAIAERRLKIAEAALREYANKHRWNLGDGSVFNRRYGWEPAEKALKEMEEATNGS